MSGSCGLMCDRCPAAARCGRTPNFCLRGRCGDCADPLLRMDVRQAVIDHLGGLDLAWRRPVRHPQPADLPDHLPVLVQAYADAVDVPWVALHGGRVFGAAGRGITPKHRLPLGDAYRLGTHTKIALELYVEDRVLEGLWSSRRTIISELRALGFDLILAPNFSVWRDHSRFEQLVQQRRAFAFYHELVDYLDTCKLCGIRSSGPGHPNPPGGGPSMRVNRLRGAGGETSVELVDDNGHPTEVVAGFLRSLGARGCSPNTVLAYAYDLGHFWRFLAVHDNRWDEFSPSKSMSLLEYLRGLACRGPAQRLGVALVSRDGGPMNMHLSPATVNRILATVSSFYEYLRVDGQFEGHNPILVRPDPALARVPERHIPFIGAASRQRPVSRVVRVKVVQRLPRPLDEEQIAALLGSMRRERDRCMVLLMLDGGLRPGEVLNLQLEDVSYARRRVVVRHRTDHPKGARTKSRIERVVDLHEPRTLASVSRYVMNERPAEGDSKLLFLLGGRGGRRLEAMSYQSFSRLFRRHCTGLGINEPWVTLHCLRHTHATRMWEGGMRELTLQKRLGHSSPESTRLYTRVPDATVVAEYRQALGMNDQ